MVRSKKVLAILLSLVMAVAMLAACTNNQKNTSENNNKGTTNNSNNNQSSNNQNSNKPTETEPGESTQLKEIRFTISGDPPTLDPNIMTDSQSAIPGSGLYEGLMRLNADGVPEYGMAESYTVSEDGLTYTFKIRSGATWSNGDPVTAGDFEYSWKRALDPEIASDYAYILYYVKGAAEYNGGTGSVDDVQVQATDDSTLVVTLTTDTPYFPSLVTHYTYWPVNPSAVEAREDWATEASTIVTNGPFLLEEWSHNNKLVLVKNNNYYAADKIQLDKVTIYAVEDDMTVYNMFQNGEIDWIGAQAGSVPNDYAEQVISSGEAEVLDIASVYYYIYNTTAPPFNNVKVRKAFAMSIDRQSIIDNVTKANQTPAYGLVPGSIGGDGDKNFREIYPDAGYFQESVDEAKKLLAEGLSELGLKAFPDTTLLYNTNDGHKAIAEAVVDMWRQNLGVEVKLANEEWGTFLETRSAQQFNIARSGWGADFNHAVNFTYDLIHSASGNNDGKYANAAVDQLLDDSVNASNEKERIAKLAEAERIGISEDMALLPIYYYTTVTMKKDHIEGVVSDFSGQISWIYGSIK